MENQEKYYIHYLVVAERMDDYISEECRKLEAGEQTNDRFLERINVVEEVLMSIFSDRRPSRVCEMFEEIEAIKEDLEGTY